MIIKSIDYKSNHFILLKLQIKGHPIDLIFKMQFNEQKSNNIRRSKK